MRIKVITEIAPTLSSRDSIDIVRKLINTVPEKTVIMDFTGVTFVSRSAAHELIALQKKYSTPWQFWKQRRISFDNLSADVRIMFNIAHQRHNRSRTSIDIPSVDLKEFNR